MVTHLHEPSVALLEHSHPDSAFFSPAGQLAHLHSPGGQEQVSPQLIKISADLSRIEGKGEGEGTELTRKLWFEPRTCPWRGSWRRYIVQEHKYTSRHMNTPLTRPWRDSLHMCIYQVRTCTRFRSYARNQCRFHFA